MILIIKHVSIEGPGIISNFFQDTAWQIQTIDFEKGDKLPGDLKGIEALIILGGSMNVYEEEKFPFLKAEDSFIKEAIKKKIPILGICLGAQLLAKAADAKVKKAKYEEIGWTRVNLTDQGRKDPLFQDVDSQLTVFQWHQDYFELPRQSRLLATSNSCRNQGFHFGKNAYGLQFHIETTPEMIASWVEEYFNGNDKTPQAQKFVIDSYKNKEMVAREADKILLNFSRMIN